MMALTLVSRLHHSTVAGSSTKEEKKKKKKGGGNTTNGHTRQPSIPSVMSWKEVLELDYSHRLGVPHGYDANSPNIGVALAVAPALQPGADYRYPRAIAEADVSEQNSYQDQDYGYGQGQGQGR